MEVYNFKTKLSWTKQWARSTDTEVTTTNNHHEDSIIMATRFSNRLRTIRNRRRSTSTTDQGPHIQAHRLPMTCDTPLSVIWCDKSNEVNSDQGVCDIRVSSDHFTLQCNAVRTDKQSTGCCMNGLKLTLYLSLFCVIRDVVDKSELLKMQLELQERTRLSFVVYMTWLFMFATAICKNYWLKVYLILWEEYNSLILI